MSLLPRLILRGTLFIASASCFTIQRKLLPHHTSVSIKYTNHLNLKRYDTFTKLYDSSSTLDTLGLVTTKLLDTAEDVFLHIQRLTTSSTSTSSSSMDSTMMTSDFWKDWNENTLSSSTTQTKPRLLVLGSGWSSHAFIKVIDTNLYRVLLVSPCNYFCFTPMIPSTSVGTIESKSIVESIRDANPSVSFLEGTVMDINLDTKIATVIMGDDRRVDTNTILLNNDDDDERTTQDDDDNTTSLLAIHKRQDDNTIEVPFDTLIYGIGVGSISSTTITRTPGLSSQNVYFLKTVLDAKKLRTGVIDLLEQASRPNVSEEEQRRLLTFVIVGGRYIRYAYNKH